MYENIPYNNGVYIEYMLYDERKQMYFCPKCGGINIRIYKRPIRHLYECGNCGFSSRGATGVYTQNSVEYQFSDVVN